MKPFVTTAVFALALISSLIANVSLYSQPVISVTKIEIQFPEVTFYLSVSCNGTELQNLTTSNFKLSENGIQIGDILVQQRPDSLGKYFLKYLLGCCIIDRNISITADKIDGCEGTVTKDVYYRRPPPDTSTFSPLTLRLGSEQAIAGQDVFLPLMFDTQISQDLSPSSVPIVFDKNLLELNDVVDDGCLLKDFAYTLTQTADGAVLSTISTGMLIGPGIFAKLHFKTHWIDQDKSVSIKLSNAKLNIPCTKMRTTDGKINILASPTDVSSMNEISFTLTQNFPNPFSDRTSITLTPYSPLPKLGEGKGERVSFKVFDVFGREVLNLSNAILDNWEQRTGNCELTIDNFQLKNPGVYFYRLTVGNESQTKMMMLLK